MSTLKILEVPTIPSSEHHLACKIDRPVADSEFDSYTMEIQGWVLGRGVAIESVSIEHAGTTLKRAVVNGPRPGVAKLHPNVKGSANCGFSTRIDVLGLPAETQLAIEAQLTDGRRFPLGTIRVRHEPLRSGFEPALQPLMLTSLGRTGTTWLMRLLAEHPKILAHRVYPYESRCASYWIHMLHVLSKPADHTKSAHPDNFQHNQFWVGFNPNHANRLLGSYPKARQWLEGDYVKDLGDFCRRSIEGFYNKIAEQQNQVSPTYFVEKYTPGHIQPLISEMYSSSRELILVRDFRDMFASICAFNTKRGSAGFGRDRVTSDEEHAQILQHGASRLLTHWKCRESRVWLVRYEDVILRPEETLTGIFNYLGIATEADLVQDIITRASRESSEMDAHRTAGSPADSIGRWKRDLSPELQAACERAFGEILRGFGYPA